MNYNDYLMHHGILGMKWGVRRYQNKDGSLTLKGKERQIIRNHRLAVKRDRARAKKLYRTLNDADKKGILEEEKEVKDAGIKRGLRSDKLRGGSELTRFSSNPDEAVNTRRKYVALTDRDKYVYEGDAKSGGLGFDPKNGVFKLTYESISGNQLKIAKAEKVAKYILGKYGDKKTKDIYKFYDRYNLRQQYKKTHEGLSKNDDDYGAYDYAYSRQQKVTGFFQKVMKDDKKVSELSSHFIKKGYDAIVDMEDYSAGYYYPLVVLNPQSSIKRKQSVKVS